MNEKSLPSLRGARVLLRGPRESDRGDRLAAGRDLAFWRMVGGTGPEPGSLTSPEVDRWYTSVAAEPFGWIVEEGGRCIGVARLHHVDLNTATGQYAAGLFRPEDRGRGIGKEVTRLVLGFAFGELRLERVELRVLDFNHAAMACYQRCGFVERGREPVSLGDVSAADVVMIASAPARPPAV
jgi:[ribosomal protein S5]-alanine N-acetyltransferase